MGRSRSIKGRCNSDKGLDDDKQRIGNDVQKIGCDLLVLARHLSLRNEENYENKFSQNTSVPTVNRTGHFPYTKQKRHCSSQLVRSKIKKLTDYKWRRPNWLLTMSVCLA